MISLCRRDAELLTGWIVSVRSLVGVKALHVVVKLLFTRLFDPDLSAKKQGLASRPIGDRFRLDQKFDY